MPVRARWWVVLAAVFAPTGAAHSQDGSGIEPSWREKASTEGKAAYEKYRAVAIRVDEESEMRSHKLPGGPGTGLVRTQTIRDHTIRLGDDLICEKVRTLDDMPGQPQINLECDNAEYHFTLRKSKEDAPYALVGYETGRRKLPLADSVNGLHQNVFSYLRLAVTAAEGSDDRFPLRGLRFDETRRLLRFEFTMDPQKNPIEQTAFLDPERGWRVIELRAENAGGVSTTQVSYGKLIEGVEFPTGQTVTTKSKVAAAHQDLEIDSKLLGLKPTDKTAADFRLAAFGFPEPPEFLPPPRPTPWYLWALAAAAVCAAVAAGLGYLHRRRTRAAEGLAKGSA